MKSVLIAMFACLLLPGAVTAEDMRWTSTDSVFVVSYESDLRPLQINKLHAWTVHIENADGEPVEGALIEATGGMPLHNHGLPTRPRITSEVGGGDYRLDGMRFHMTGQWEITLLITDGDKSDTVVISLSL